MSHPKTPQRRLRVGLLMTVDAPMGGYVIQAMLERGVTIDALIFDSKIISQVDLDLHEERTGGRLPPIGLHTFEHHKIPGYFVANHNSAATLSLLEQLDLDILVNAGTPRILKNPILNAPRIGVLNCHPGLLPHYRGCSCVEWAIFNDEPVGNSVHLMTEEIDEGDVLMTEPLSFASDATYQDIRIGVYQAGFELLAEATHKLNTFVLDRASFKPQDEGRYYGPIDEDSMAEVLTKVREGRYQYQSLSASNPPPKSQ
ncbi:formyltransferase family protein [Magnetovibrio sp.]|uniref:formyltransferase family protein n=1 Tax=Magnetovibrio sp. TaxID=2024836 RepID=UPI002F929A68